MAGILDGLDSNIYGAPAATAQPGAQQQPDIFKRLQQLFGGGGYSVGGNPLGLGQNGFSVPQIHPTPQPPAMGGQPAEAPNFAPPIQPRVPPFALLAQLRQKLGLPAMPQQPQQAQASPLAAMTDPSLLALYG